MRGVGVDILTCRLRQLALVMRPVANERENRAQSVDVDSRYAGLGSLQALR